MDSPRDRLIFALDVPNAAEAERTLDVVADHIGVAKIGLELFVAEGPAIVRTACRRGLRVFLDLKLHDIPETVERAVRRAAQLDIDFLTVHASGGPAMLERAVKATAGSRTKIVAVTVLTSLQASDLAATGVSASPLDHARSLAMLAQEAGVEAFVCSPHEAGALRSALGARKAVDIITPGVRPSGVDSGDQKRTATAHDAIRNGATYVVVGRPIRDAADPRAAANALVAEITSALAQRPTP